LKIALIEAPTHSLTSFRWEDVYFPETPFPICEYLNDQQNELRIWDLEKESPPDGKRLIKDLLSFQPVVVGINDHQTTHGLVIERLVKQMFPRALVFFSPQQMTPQELLDKANQNAFSLRHRTKPMAGKIRMRRTWENEELFSVLPAAIQPQAYALEAEFNQKYSLNDWKQYLSDAAYRRNLYMLEILEETLPAHLPFWQQRVLRILDVGAGAWSYAPAIYQFFRYAHSEAPRKVYLTGVELDPYRIDDDGYSRVDYALSYIDPIASQCRYLIQDIGDYKPELPYHVILQFLPLVLETAHLFWGLPLKYYHPQASLQHLLELLAPEGAMVIANEIPAEFEYQLKLWQAEKVTPYLEGAFYSRFRQAVAGFVSAANKNT
jgi:SAM-dependent methyltransferase